MTQLAALVDTASAVAATRARSAKVAALAELLRHTHPDDAAAALGLLLGRPRQGRIGVGWRSLVTARDAAPPAGTAALTVAEVDAVLTAYAAASGPGSVAIRAGLLADLLSRATGAERDFLVASLGGEVRTGALEGVLTDALASATGRPLAEVRRAVMLSGSLLETAARGLADPSVLGDVRLAVLTPLQPMLASPGSDVAAAMASVEGLASVEHKLDGARIQVHRVGDTVRVFTRSLADVTARVPEIVETARGLSCDQVILDGETLMLDDDGAPRPFQETMSRFGTHGGSQAALAPRFFDVLHLDGEDLIDRPLRERRDALARLAAAYVVDGAVTDDPAVAERVLHEALAAGHEGVVIKGMESLYAAGRRGASWLKVKPVHTLDLVVLGAEWGSGRRRGLLSNIHLGARDCEGTYGDPGGFVMVGKTFKGMTDELLAWQTATFPAFERGRSSGVVWLRPELVVEVAVDGVQRSPRYPGGVALRFARVKGYRPDKTPLEADSIEALQEMLRP